MDRIAEILVDYERRRQHGDSLVFSTFGADYRLVCLQLAAFFRSSRQEGWVAKDQVSHFRRFFE